MKLWQGGTGELCAGRLQREARGTGHIYRNRRRRCVDIANPADKIDDLTTATATIPDSLDGDPGRSGTRRTRPGCRTTRAPSRRGLPWSPGHPFTIQVSIRRGGMMKGYRDDEGMCETWSGGGLACLSRSGMCGMAAYARVRDAGRRGCSIFATSLLDSSLPHITILPTHHSCQHTFDSPYLPPRITLAPSL